MEPHNADLLLIIKALLHDDDAVNAFLKKENEKPLTEVQRMELRTKFIKSLLKVQG